MPRRAHVERHTGRRELAVFALAYLTYFGVRALTQGDAAAALRNARGIMRAEERLGLDHEHAVQALVVSSRTLTDASNFVYMYGHWPVLLGAGLLLFRYRRSHYRVLRDACLLSGLVGLVIFAAFPVAPPRLTNLPLVDTVTKNAPGYRLLIPHSLVNEYAAMPSFHAGWNLLVGVVVFRATRNPVLRAFALVMPAAMVFAVVATANHFVLDVIVGVGIALVALHGANVLERRRTSPTLLINDAVVDRAASAPARPRAVRDRASRGQRPPASAAR